MTQIEFARKGIITEVMEKIAKDENVSPEFIREKVSEGEIVIPFNPNHKSLKKPCGIGSGLRTKINANIGTSFDYVNIDEEIEKLKVAIEYGADTVMDLSTGGDLKKIREKIIENSIIPVGTVPIYEAEIRAAQEKGSIFEMTPSLLFEVIEEHGKSGVDFITVHVGITLESLKRLKNQKRITGIVSRGGGLLAVWMMHNKKENPLYEKFDELLDIAREYDMTLSLGDGLRPGSIIDATDRAQIEELILLGELVERARSKGVQVMVEGPGHIPINEIKMNVEMEKKFCKNAPFYVLGPLPCDTGAGFDHIVGAIGGALAASYGVDFLCYVTPSEHLGLPKVEDVKHGVIASKIAAHIGDLAKGIKSAWEMNKKLSEARYKLKWEEEFKYMLFPEEAKKIFEERKSETKACSMCGPFCPMNLFEEYIKERI
ncbi:MAG: phosphomethylpyrimidine synthase ThiC [candidate division WOR-3 bacterium]